MERMQPKPTCKMCNQSHEIANQSQAMVDCEAMIPYLCIDVCALCGHYKSAILPMQIHQFGFTLPCDFFVPIEAYFKQTIILANCRTYPRRA